MTCFDVSGMTCQSCVEKIERCLNATSGIITVKVTGVCIRMNFGWLLCACCESPVLSFTMSYRRPGILVKLIVSDPFSMSTVV